MRILFVLVAFLACGIVNADFTEGEKLSEDLCYDCHYVDEGEMAELDATFDKIKGIVDGSVKHRKKLELTDEEIQSLVEYFSTFDGEE